MFDPSKRNIFEYHDGTRPIKADPIVLGRALDAAFEGEDFGALCRDAVPDLGAIVPEAVAGYVDSVVIPSREKLLAGTRVAFGVQALDADGKGLTEEETLDVLDAFLVWMDREKKEDGTSPSSSTPTDGPPGSS